MNRALAKPWLDVAASGTNVFFRGVVHFSQGEGLYTWIFDKTGTGTGAITLEANNDDKEEYQVAIDAAGSPEANTTRWSSIGLVDKSGAFVDFIAVTAADPEDHNLRTDQTGWARLRLVFENLTGTQTINGRGNAK